MSVSPSDENSEISARQRYLELSDERKAQILDPAQEEFARHGFNDASLNRILQKAGISKGQSYYYFADKQALFFAVLERAYQRLQQEVAFTFGHPQTPQDYWAQIQALFIRVNMVFASNEELTAVALRIHENDITRHIAQKLPFRTAFDDLLHYGQSIGAIRVDLPNDLLGNTLFTMAIEIDRWFSENWRTLESAELAVLNQKAIKLFEAICIPEITENL